MIHQAQEELYNYRPVFEMPVDLKINYSAGGDTTITVWNNEQTQTYYFALNQEVSSVLFDPDKWILRKSLYNPDIPVSVESNDIADQIFIYPNPFTSYLDIKIEGKYFSDLQIQVYDLEGKYVNQLFMGSYQPGTIVRWDGCSENGNKAEPGFYLIELRSGNTVFSKRVILK